MKEIAPNTYLIDAQYFQEGFNAVYLIVSQGKAMLVDCGTAHSVPHIEKAMAEIGLGWDDLDRNFFNLGCFQFGSSLLLGLGRTSPKISSKGCSG